MFEIIKNGEIKNYKEDDKIFDSDVDDFDFIVLSGTMNLYKIEKNEENQRLVFT